MAVILVDYTLGGVRIDSRQLHANSVGPGISGVSDKLDVSANGIALARQARDQIAAC